MIPRPTAGSSRARRCRFQYGEEEIRMSKRFIAILAMVMAFALAAPALGQVPAAVQEALFNYLTTIAQDFNSITVQAVKARLDAGEQTFILDVRETSEFDAGHIAGAVNIPIRTIAKT